jgi:O-antigen/teichoic acid export membrane protein
MALREAPEPASVPSRTSGRRIVSTALSLASVQGVTWMTTLAMVFLLPRFVGAEDFGILSVMGAVGGIVMLLAGFGTNNHIVKSVARYPERAADTVANAALMRFGIWIVCLVISMAAGVVIGLSSTLLLTLGVSLVWNLVSMASGTIALGLQGNQTVGKYAVVSTFGVATATGLGLAVAGAGGGPLGWVTTNAVIAGLTLLILARIFWSRCAGPIRLGASRFVDTMKDGGPFLLFEVSLFTLSGASVLLLAWLAGTVEVGRLTLALRIAGIPLFLPTILVAALYPALATSALNDQRWFGRSILGALRIMLLLLLPLSALMVIFASTLVDLIGGAGFEDARWPIILMSAAIPLIAVDMLLATALFSLDRQRTWTIIVTSVAGTAILLNLGAIPLAGRLFGLPEVGPVAVSLVTELVLSTSAVIMLRRIVRFRSIVAPVLKTLLAAALMSAVILLALERWWMVPSVAAGAFAYVAVVVMLRIVDREDLAWLVSTVRSRLPSSATPGAPQPIER